MSFVSCCQDAHGTLAGTICVSDFVVIFVLCHSKNTPLLSSLLVNQPQLAKQHKITTVDESVPVFSIEMTSLLFLLAVVFCLVYSSGAGAQQY